MFTWDKSYSVQIKEIDSQHQHFFELANKILDETQKGEPNRQIVLDVVYELGDYAMYHLSTEEELFDRCHYSEAEEHKKSHQMFREKIKALIEELRGVNGYSHELAKEVAEFAGNWLMKHILIMDKKYAEPLHVCGIK